MSADPYLVDGPAVISFSGGRTSAYMLRKILDRGLQPDVKVMFANTGKERVETLDFVHACEVAWGLDVHWLEYRRAHLPKYRSPDRSAAAEKARIAAGRPHLPPGPKESGYVRVTYETASRNGEPFDNLIEMMALPNVTTRMCTQEMKIRVIKKAMVDLGYTDWTNVVGIRADEPVRVARMRAPTGQRWENQVPLADAGVTEADVLAFWDAQPFNLKLKTYEGNCDLCFLKATWKREQIAREHPELVEWWASREEITGMQFRSHTAAYRKLPLAPTEAPSCATPDVDDDLGDCICHE